MKRGFTLIEILIATIIGGLVLTMALSLYVTTLHLHSTDVGLYELEKDVATLVDALKADLRETNLGSINIGSNPSTLSLASATPLGELNNFQVNHFGAPKWQKYVFYGLSTESEKKGLSKLIRHEAPNSAGLPLPWQGGIPGTEESDKRIISRSILAPKYALKPDAQGLVQLEEDEKSEGGFHCRFVTADNSLRTEFPDSKEATRMLECQFEVVEITDDGKVSSAEFAFRVFPRN